MERDERDERLRKGLVGGLLLAIANGPEGFREGDDLTDEELADATKSLKDAL